ncbi:uncharacterized protein LOC123310484 [Coccinella septempunctata]|uniref:uncharacterized protein LOC123310484 n=1 Tax=Coccinella septempunctata TaxID=41139 RepID=UPI001D08ED10|nr:uncharacterized protein LOC123310484 [Coccinella septempunctata]
MFKLRKIIDIQAARKPALVVAMKRDTNTNRVAEESVLKITKCLFGKCDPDDTLRMLEEQIEMDKLRFMERFGIDIDSLERGETENVNPNIMRKPSDAALQKLNGNQKRKLTTLKSKRITDFYKVKKPRIQEKENNPS